MKTCDEMVNSLFQRREQYLAEQKIKRRNAVISTTLYCCAFAAVTGIGVWIKGEVSRKPVTVDSSMTNPDSATGNSSEDLLNLPIKWAESLGNYGDLVTDMDDITEWNSKRISGMLSDALNEGGKNCLYAVEARCFSIDKQFVYNGKTLAQYEAEYGAKWDELDSKLFIKKLLEAADYLKIENGDKISKDTYDELVSDIGEEISEYIIDGVFLKDKAVQDITKAEDEWKATMQAENQAYKACRANYYKEVGKQLETKGIRNEFIYEDSDPGDYLDSGFISDYLLLFISKEDFADLALDNMSDWIFCHAYNNTELPIIWAKEKIEGEVVTDYYTEWNGKEIHSCLWDALEENETDDNCLFAISARYFSIDYQFEYNGKTLSQYNKEQQGKRCKLLNELLKEGEALKYGEALYQSGTPDGEKWSKELYDSTVAKYGEEFLSQYIVDGVFLKDKVLRDIPEAEKEMEAAQTVFEQACAAYRVHVYEGTLEQLETQGIRYELTKNPDNLLLFISKEDFADLALDNMSDWIFYHAYKKAELPIVWYEGFGYDADIITVFGNKRVNSSLWNLSNEEQNDCLIAIDAQYGYVDSQFVYNGKTLAEYETEEETQKRKVNSLGILLNDGEALKYGEALYQSGTPDGEKWTKELYDKTVAEIGEDYMSEYIVNGVFLKEKASRDYAKAEEDWGTAQRDHDKARSAYRANIYEKTAKQLETQGIKTAYSSDPDYLLLFISRDDFADLNLDNMSEWFFVHASKDIYTEEYERFGGYARYLSVEEDD